MPQTARDIAFPLSNAEMKQKLAERKEGDKDTFITTREEIEKRLARTQKPTQA